MNGWVASLNPTGTRFAPVNSKCPMTFVPAFRQSWAPAFNRTPRSTSPKLTPVTACSDASVVARVRRPGRSRLAHEHPARVTGDELHWQVLLLESLVPGRAHERDGAWGRPPDGFE